MKAVRLITFILVLAIAFSVWTPSTAYAGSAAGSATHSMIEKAKSTVVRISVTNKTGGTMYINLVGEGRSYFFAAPKIGKNTFEILPGKYTYTLTNSACRGSFSKTRSFKSGSASLGAWMCSH